MIMIMRDLSSWCIKWNINKSLEEFYDILNFFCRQWSGDSVDGPGAEVSAGFQSAAGQRSGSDKNPEVW